VHFALWPYALRNAALLHNTLPVLEDGTSRLELFSSIHVGSNTKHVHTFGCPVFALQNELASGKSLPRWSSHARLGLNLGPSPMHARIVYLVLNLITGYVSPQYHCRFVDFFETTRHGGHATPVTAGTSLCGRVCTRDSSRYSPSTQKTRSLTYSPNLWHKTTFNVTVALCAASNLPQATKVRECYENRVLLYLLTVLTYQSHIMTL
jgi:hypothetical protein